MKEEASFALSWPVITISLLSFLVVYRNYGGFFYRNLVNLLCFVTMAVYGTIIALVLPLFGKRDLINWSVARGYYYLGGFFTGVRVEVEGEENLHQHEGPAIYVCNHQSSLDIMLMGKVYPKNTAIIAKKQLKYVPFLGMFVRLNNTILLDRKNRESAVKEARKAAEDIQKKNTNVWVFPEGTRGHESEVTLLPFKKGPFYMAVQAHVPIIPVVLSNYTDLYSAKQKRFNSGVVRCRVLPAISTEGVEETSADIEKLATECREQMLTALKEITIKDKSQ
ncbi:hypothetical protein EDC96DRAFT_484769 [Choanephora cucurbitarum]|nr:hypothetical protein EDC96DRAFT_484769 [Choanephora cucurbitarum]